MNTFIKSEHDEIVRKANDIIDYFWGEMKYYSHDKNFGYLGLRFREREKGISLEWYNSFYSSTGVMKRKKNHIKKGKGDSYNLNKIKNHKYRRDYEIDLIDCLEPKCAEL